MATKGTKFTKFLLFVFFLFFVAIVFVNFAVRTNTLPESRVTNRPFQSAGDGYVGSGTCRACHPDQYASWHASYHRTMTTPASRETVIPLFQGAVSVGGAVVELEQQGGEFWATFDDPDVLATGRVRRIDAPRIRRQIVLVTGSHHQQVFWHATGRKRLLGQLPITYLVEEREWIPRRAAFMHPPVEAPVSETGHWNAICVGCHATNGKPWFDKPPGSEPLQRADVDTRVSEFGIACEACHGPGGEHARVNRNPLRRYGLHLTGTPDGTIVHPARLDARRSADVCGQCHSVWDLLDAASERRENYQGVPFRPGGDLRASRFIAEPVRRPDSARLKELLRIDPRFVADAFWPDGMVSVSGREYNGLIESACYARGTDHTNTMTCASCHAMHRPGGDARSLEAWRNDQLKPAMDGDEACLQCHQPYRETSALKAHTRHTELSSGSRCYNCHMPYTTYGLLKAIRSHQVSSPSVQTSLDTGRPNACNLCHLDKSVGWTSARLATWYGMPEPEMDEDDRALPAGAVWMLRGDAQQRALAAYSAGWVEARDVSGAAWMVPILRRLSEDPYDAVRFIARRSLSAFAADVGRAGVNVGPYARNDADTRSDPYAPADHESAAHAALDLSTVERLVRLRDDRRVFLRE